MVFSSFTFILAFLPLTAICYFAARKELKNAVLLFASLIFYAWGEPIYVFLMIASIIVNYFLALGMSKGKVKNLLFAVAIVFNIAVIGFFKYGDFVIGNINNLFGSHIGELKLALPIGISFYTFQVFSYVIDVWKGKSGAQQNIVRLGTYISFFPQLIAGPIVKYEVIKNQLDPAARRVGLDDVGYGMRRFIVGLAKKVIIANQMGLIVEGVQAMTVGDASRGMLWIAAVCYVYQLYFDFSGYSDMAIGLSRIFGFKFPENFLHPFASRSAAEFWQRFHISLISWFREYVYIPLGGNRVSTFRWVLNILIVWMLTGLWHGAGWNFVLWGLTYAIIMIAEGFVMKKTGLRHKHFHGPVKYIGSVFGWAWAMFAYIFTCVIFRLTDFDIMLATLKKMFFVGGASGSQSTLAWVFSSSDITVALLFFPIAFFGAFPLTKKFIDKFYGNNLPLTILIALFYIAIFYASITMLLGQTFNPFIYFRF